MSKPSSRGKIVQDERRKSPMSSPNNESALMEVYELKIKDLMEKLEKAKEKNKLLQSENEQLSKAQAKSVTEKQDIVEFLRIELTNHETTLSATEAKLAALEQEKSQLLQAHTLELKHHLEDHGQEKEQLQQKIMKLNQDLNELAEFRGRKEMMEKEVRAMTLELEQKEKAFKTELTNLERKHLQDKHVLRKDMLTKVTEAVTTFRRAADLQMAETTKKAIKENLVVTAQLRKMAGKTTDLLVENELLKTNNTKLKLDKEMLEQMQTELITKNLSLEHFTRHLIQKLNSNFTTLSTSNASLNASLPSTTLKKKKGRGTPPSSSTELLSHPLSTSTNTTVNEDGCHKDEMKDSLRLLTSLSHLLQPSYDHHFGLPNSQHKKTFPYVRRLIQDLKSHRCTLKWCVPTFHPTSSATTSTTPFSSSSNTSSSFSSIEHVLKPSPKKKSGNPLLVQKDTGELNHLKNVVTKEEDEEEEEEVDVTVNKEEKEHEQFLKEAKQQEQDFLRPTTLTYSHLGPTHPSSRKKKEVVLKKGIRWDRSTTASSNPTFNLSSTKVGPMKELLPYISIPNK